MVAGIGLRCHKCESDFERDTLIEDEWCWMPHIQSLFFCVCLLLMWLLGVLLLTYSYRLFALLVFIFFVLCLKCSSCGCCARPTPSHTKIYCIFFLYRVIYLFSDIMCVAFEITPFSGDDIWKYVFPIFFFIKISGTGFFCFLRLCVNCSALLFSWQQRCVRTLLRWEIRLCASGGSWIVRFSIYIFFFFLLSLTHLHGWQIWPEPNAEDMSSGWANELSCSCIFFFRLFVWLWSLLLLLLLLLPHGCECS